MLVYAFIILLVVATVRAIVTRNDAQSRCTRAGNRVVSTQHGNGWNCVDSEGRLVR